MTARKTCHKRRVSEYVGYIERGVDKLSRVLRAVFGNAFLLRQSGCFGGQLIIQIAEVPGTFDGLSMYGSATLVDRGRFFPVS